MKTNASPIGRVGAFGFSLSLFAAMASNCGPPDPVGEVAKPSARGDDAKAQASVACTKAARIVRALSNDDRADDPTPDESKARLSEGNTAAIAAAEKDEDRFLPLSVAYGDLINGIEDSNPTLLDNGYRQVSEECSRIFK